jgi:signal transduction histidine kinase
MRAGPYRTQPLQPGDDPGNAGLPDSRRDIRQHELDAMARFASRAAHDLSDILTLFLGTATLLLEELPLDHPRRRQVMQVEQVARRATMLTRQLSVLSRHMQLAPPGPRLALVQDEHPRRNDGADL